MNAVPAVSADSGQHAAPAQPNGDQIVRTGEEVEPILGRAMSLVTEQARRSQWPGGVLGLVGFALIAATFVLNVIPGITIETTEYVTGLIAGSVLALLGPSIIFATTAYTQNKVEKIAEKSEAERIAELRARQSH
jgi:hypothetical protein